MKLEDKDKLVVLAIVGHLIGLAWTVWEDLADHSKKLEQKATFDKLLAILDARLFQTQTLSFQMLSKKIRMYSHLCFHATRFPYLILLFMKNHNPPAPWGH